MVQKRKPSAVASDMKVTAGDVRAGHVDITVCDRARVTRLDGLDTARPHLVQQPYHPVRAIRIGSGELHLATTLTTTPPSGGSRRHTSTTV